jgi:hypothetical protein
MHIFKFFLLVVLPCVGVVPASVLLVQSCAGDTRGCIIVRKIHASAYVEALSGRHVNPSWALDFERDGKPVFMLECSPEAFQALEVGDRPEIVTVTLANGATMLRLARDAETGWRPIAYAPAAEISEIPTSEAAGKQ